MICKYKDLEVVLVLSFEDTLFQAKHCIMKYCLYEEPEPKKQSKKISNYQELIQSDPTSCPQNKTIRAALVEFVYNLRMF